MTKKGRELHGRLQMQLERRYYSKSFSIPWKVMLKIDDKIVNLGYSLHDDELH
jgi:hypothetical protein